MKHLFQAIWEWLDTNSGAVQAATAILSAGATVILALLTGWYVNLTKRLSDATQAQLRAALDSRLANERTRGRQLSALIVRFEEVASQLPWFESQFNDLSKVALWTEEDIESFEAAMVASGPGAASLGREMTEALRWLLAECQRLQRHPDSPDKVDPQMYRHHLGKLRLNLLQIPLAFAGDSVGAFAEPQVRAGKLRAGGGRDAV